MHLESLKRSALCRQADLFGVPSDKTTPRSKLIDGLRHRLHELAAELKAKALNVTVEQHGHTVPIQPVASGLFRDSILVLGQLPYDVVYVVFRDDRSPQVLWSPLRSTSSQLSKSEVTERFMEPPTIVQRYGEFAVEPQFRDTHDLVGTETVEFEFDSDTSMTCYLIKQFVAGGFRYLALLPREPIYVPVKLVSANQAKRLPEEEFQSVQVYLLELLAQVEPRSYADLRSGDASGEFNSTG